MKKRLFFTLLLCLWLSVMSLTVAPSKSYACSCAGPNTVEDEFEKSEAVFSGTVIKIKEKKKLGGYITKNVLFEVNKTWKGVSESQIIIVTGQGGGDCGYEFHVGTEYLVYAVQSSQYGDKDDLTTGICDRTAKLSSLKKDLLLLGEGKAPEEKVDLENELSSQGINVMMSVLGIAIVGLAAFFILKRSEK